jgi:MFS family permease
VGEASYATIAPTLIDDLAPPSKKGKWLSIFYVAMPVGAALGYKVGGWVGKVHGWRDAFFVAGGPGLLLALVCLLIAEPTRVATKVDMGAEPYRAATFQERAAPLGRVWRELVSSPLYVKGVLGYSASTFAVGGFAIWAPTFLVRRYAIDLDVANGWMGVVTVLSGLLGTAMGGVWSDRATRSTAGSGMADSRARAFLRICAVSSAIAAPLAALALLASKAAWFFPLFFLAETAIFVSTSPINAVVLETVPVALRATAMAGSIFAIHVLGDLWSPPGVGLLADLFSMPVAMLALPIAVAVSAAVWWPRQSTLV